ncbi:hypothetical protein SCLCIDRAFT_23718 [Scleroderma citrinum Foug A]|uniref:CCHC-type domain-containing protein n=1 Tax=Scleroderma citrinum Foug A TaxID=1036808 RepID=A0A0C3E7Z7_9AGAM|nr:hypothetical protein SCLCIDRAFT_23718 [Scleroderma citrinum Foug A]
MTDLQNILAQLAQGQIDLQNHIAALAAAQPAPVPPPRKKVVADPGTYDGSPAKFHKWWSKIKTWILVSMQGTTDAEVTAAVYSHLTSLKAGHWTHVHLDQCMAAAVAHTAAPAGHNLPNPWPTWDALTVEIEGSFLPRNNREWAHAQLLQLRQDKYAWDLLEWAVSRKILEQVYLQASDRGTYANLCESVCKMGRAQELFLINSQGSPQYYQGTYTPSSSSASGSGTPMDIGATNTHPQPHGKGLQCYNCQGFGHIARKCTQPCRPQQQQQTQSAQQQGGNSDDERINASDDETGIITLESPLDTAVCILDHRLSLTTDNVARTIYEYQISLLQRKIEKTHKKLATSVSSSAPVSSNKYASLVVEDVDTQYTMDCADTTTSFVSCSSTVPSMGVSRSGSAPDVKRGVLNSRVSINGQESPFLASSDLESPTDDLEVVEALLDSGATGCFVDKSWALDRCLRLSKLVKPVPVLNVNGTRNQEGDIMHYVLLTVSVGKHAEKLWCAVTCLGKVPLILSHDWLKKHNPDIDWTTGDIKLSCCPPKCKSLMDMDFTKLISNNESQETWIQALKNHESKGDVDKSTLEEAQKLVPHEYWDYLDVFSKSKRGFPTEEGSIDSPLVDEQKEVEAFLDDQLSKGYIRPSNSQQTSPVFFNNYLLPLISQLVDKLKGCKLFTKMDLRWGYNNMQIREGDEWKAVFTMHKGSFKPLIMYFGLCNLPATFQKMMNEIFHDMSDVCIVYINDLMIFMEKDNQVEHDRIVLEVLRWLRDNDLFVKPEKCHFRVTEVNFLGMIISCDGIKMDPEKVNTILKWPEPTNVKQVRAFLGLGNFYKHFIKDYAIISRPMVDLTCKDVIFNFGDKEKALFKALKAAFTTVPMLQYPDQDHKFCLEIDMSEFAIGGVISVKCNDGKFRPIAYMSHSMTPPE